jgi:hypothetical protein
LDSVQQVTSARKLQRAKAFFWISLFTFCTTMCYGAIHWYQLANQRGGGLEIIGEIVTLFLLTFLGTCVSLFFCLLSISRYKWAVLLLIVELVPLVLPLVSRLSVGRPGP